MRGFGVIVILDFYYMKTFLKFISNRRLLICLWPFTLKIGIIPHSIVYFLKATVVAYSKIYDSFV